MDLSWSNPSFEQNVLCYLQTPGSALFAVLPIKSSESMKGFFRAASKEAVEKEILMAALQLEQVVHKGFAHRIWEKQGGWIVLAADSFILPLFHGAIPCHTCVECCSERFLKRRGIFNNQLKQIHGHHDAITTVAAQKNGVYFLCSLSERRKCFKYSKKHQ